MKVYEKPMMQYFDLRLEERIATGSACVRTGYCEKPVYKSPNQFSNNIVDE